MDILAKLFGGNQRVKVLRLFMLNPDTVFETKNIVRRSQTPSASTRHELGLLESIGLIQSKKTVVLTPVLTKRGKPRKKRVQGWQLNKGFPLLHHLKALLSSELLANQGLVGDRFKRCGKIKFLAVAGVFLEDPHSRVDLMVVGDDLKRGKIENVVKALESEIGKELNYAVLETKDFLYRVDACDKFVRDLLDYPHERVINKLTI